MVTTVIHPLDWDADCILGHGSYGTVWKVVSPDGSGACAVKILQNKRDWKHEVCFLKAAAGLPHVLRMTGSEAATMRICTDLKACTLYDMIPSLSLEDVRHAMEHVLTGVAGLHARKIVHLDIKPNNILYDDVTDTYCLADLGMARRVGAEMSSYVSTFLYRPPELIELNVASRDTAIARTAHDMWSVGCVFAHLLMKIPMYARATDECHLHAILKASPPITWIGRAIIKEASPHRQYALDLLLQLLDLDPDRRITADRALKHPYFRRR